MIKFSCMLCGEKLSVQDQLSGKRIKCPKCNNTSVVPADSPRIRFDCPNCGKGIRVLQIHAGKEGKCPKCKSPVVVPSLKADPAEDPGTVAVVCSMCNEKIRVPKDSQERFTECPACGSNVETSLRGEPVESDSSIPQGADEDEYEEEYQDESDLPEDDEGPDRRLILVICGAAVVAVVGLIIFITVILPSGSEPREEPPVLPRQEVADSDSPSDPVAPSDRPAGTFTLEPPKEAVAVKSPAGSPTEASDDARNLDLKLRLKPGAKRRLRLYREFSSSYTVNGQQQDSSGTLTTELEFEVEQVDANGVMLLKVTHLRFHETETEGGKKEYDSSKPGTLGNSHFGYIFSALIGRSFMAKVTPEGKVVELEGLAQMYQQMAEPLVDYQDEATRLTYDAETAKRRLDAANRKFASREERIEATRDKLDKGPYTRAENIRDMLGEVIMFFPGEHVGIGDSWKAAPSSMRALDLGDYTYTLRENKQAAALVHMSTKIDVDREQPASADGNRGSSRTTLSGSGQGSVEIDPGTGWMLRKDMTSRYSGETKTGPTRRDPRGTTVAQSMENITTVEPIE